MAESLEAYDSEMLGRVIDINLKGVFYGIKHTLPYLKAQGSGAIVNAASVGGIRAVPNQVAYGASKHAVAGMTKDAAIEYGQYGVSVNAVAPGAIMTGMVKGSLIQMAGEEGWEEAGDGSRARPRPNGPPGSTRRLGKRAHALAHLSGERRCRGPAGASRSVATDVVRAVDVL